MLTVEILSTLKQEHFVLEIRQAAKISETNLSNNAAMLTATEKDSKKAQRPQQYNNT